MNRITLLVKQQCIASQHKWWVINHTMEEMTGLEWELNHATYRSVSCVSQLRLVPGHAWRKEPLESDCLCPCHAKP